MPQKHSLYWILALSCVCVNSGFAALASDRPFNVILVDKAKNEIHLAQTDDSTQLLKPIKKYHVTLGKAKGDKLIENDLKTPEGFYIFNSRRTPPHIKAKLGVMALGMNYPNPIDQIEGKTGYAIMLHGTDDPSRLKRNQDSEGCVVVDNPEVAEVSQYVQLGLTPILVYDELQPQHFSTKATTEVESVFRSWLEGWQNKDIDKYIGAYADGFRYNGMNLKQYREYKASLNKKYSAIKVKADNLRFFSHPKYDVVYFTQRYESEMKGGGKGFKSSGTKWLYLAKNAAGQYKILDESYSNLCEN